MAASGAAFVYFGSRLIPDITSRDSVRYVSGIYAIATGLLLLFMRQFSRMDGSGTLSVREMERYTRRRAVIRERIWVLFAASAAGAVAMWVIGSLPCGPLPKIAFGALLGIGIGFCLTAVRWIDDLATFGDAIKLRAEQQKAAADLKQRLATARKEASSH